MNSSRKPAWRRWSGAGAAIAVFVGVCGVALNRGELDLREGSGVSRVSPERGGDSRPMAREAEAPRATAGQTAPPTHPRDEAEVEPVDDERLAGLMTALGSLRREVDPAIRERLFTDAIGAVPRDLRAKAIGFLREQGSKGPAWELGQRLVRQWAEANAVEAAAWVVGAARGPFRDAAMRTIALEWHRADAAAAMAWIEGLPSGVGWATALVGLAYELAGDQPLEALRLASLLAPGPERSDLVVHAVRQWAVDDPEQSAGWTLEIGPGALRETALAGLATAWAGSDPTAAATLAVVNLAPGKEQSDAVVGIVQRWAQDEPEVAADWVGQFPEGPLREMALVNLVQQWADAAPEVAGAWLNGAELGTSRDVVVREFVSRIAPRAPEIAARWAESVEDEALRTRSMITAGEAWLAKDPAAAAEWIQKAPLTEPNKSRLLASARPAVP